jgi:uncharacterized membrane protein YkvA (DUF1232 family)
VEWLLAAAVALLIAYAGLVAALVARGRRGDARALAGFVPDCVVLFRRLLGDPRLPRRRRLLVGALVLYLLSPVDLVPDFIPVAGQLDDAIVAGLVLRLVLRGGGAALVEQHWPGPQRSLRVVLRFGGLSREPVEEVGTPGAGR